MHVLKCLRALALPSFLIMTAFAWTASAQSTDQQGASQESSRIEITPFFAFGDDLALGAGTAVTFPWTQELGVEVEASLGRDAARSSLSLIYSLPAWGRWSAFLAGGAGVQRDEFVDLTTVTDNFLPRIGKKTEFAVNVGAGVTVPVTDRWRYRFDFRWYNPKKEWPESWRMYSGIVFDLRR